MPTVSVIIPLYNKSNNVARAIDSVFHQTYKDFDVVVVDDGSTDNSLETVMKYRDPRLQIVLQANMGPGAARNTGVGMSSSPYVAFLDADDEWLPDFLRLSLSNLRSNPDCVLSVTNHYRGKERILATSIPPCDIGIAPGPWRLPREIEPGDMWGSLIYLQSWVVVCRRDVFRENGGFYEHHCTFGEDQYLWLRILLKHKIYRDTIPLHIYHSEDSELEWYLNCKLPVQLFPFVMDPEPILKNCPPDYRLTLDRFLNYVAMIDFERAFGKGDMAVARELIRRLAAMMQLGIRVKRWSLIQLRLKVLILAVKDAFPWVVLAVRILKKLVLGSQSQST